MDSGLGRATVSIIAAVSDNGVIGRDGDLPWPRIREDFARFKKLTVGHIVVVGRITHESIMWRLGKPLPDRTTCVVMHEIVGYTVPLGVALANSVEAALEFASNQPGETEVFIIGGAQIYKEAFEKKLADKLYLTRVHAKVGGDTYFPVFNTAEWVLVECDTVATNVCDVTFETYERRKRNGW